MRLRASSAEETSWIGKEWVFRVTLSDFVRVGKVDNKFFFDDVRHRNFRVECTVYDC